MLLVLIPVTAGIVIADSYVLPLYAVLATMLGGVVVAWLCSTRYVRWCYIGIALIAFGYLIAELRAPTHSTPYNQRCEMVVTVDGIPAQRDGYRLAQGYITAWHSDSGWHEANDRVQLWIRSRSVAHGSLVRLEGVLRERISRHDGYNELLHRRGFVGGVGIDDYNTLALEHKSPEGLHYWALQRLGRYHSDSTAHATLEAMVAGSRLNLTPELRDAYSRTGLAHLMAVSGLHLGIVLMVVGALFAPLRLVHRGHRLINLLIIIALWLFALLSGASPSVIRSATMLTVIQLAYMSSHRYNSINVLAATLFIMLAYRPNYLFDISFELSAAAVFGIVAWGIPLIHSTASRHHIGGPLRSTLIIGVVATLWTLPLISHSFGNIPLVGVILTPLVMLLCYVIVGGGILSIILPSPLATPLIAAAEWAGGLQNDIVAWAAKWPWAAVEYQMSEGGVALCYALFALITAFIWSRNNVVDTINRK